MLCTEQTVRDNIRNRDGKRVFYLAPGDSLTSGARDWLQSQRIAILPASQARPRAWQLPDGTETQEKPDEMTHLRGNILVEKTHPAIRFRGEMDTLESQILLLQLEAATGLRKHLQELLELSRQLIRREVMEEPVQLPLLGGMTAGELRHRSQFPREDCGQPHFMPSWTDGPVILKLNALRCSVRRAELAAAALPDREDIVQALNRMSSMVYLLMIREKAGKREP